MSTPAPGEFAERLRRHREAAALSQEELAARAGLTAKAIGALERGERRRPYPHTVRALAEALDLSDPDRAALTAAVQGTTPRVDKATSRHLPLSPTRLVGRDAERRQVLDLLTNGARLVTVTGTGGVGKTSLALDVARDRSRDTPVTVVELAPLRDPAQVLPAIARALDVRLAGPPAEAIAATLGASEHLLVLDNVEHLLDAAPAIAELLARCPGLTVLATSRAALRIRAEHDFPLSPLAVPTSGRDVAASPAARIFLDRARAAGRPVPLTEDAAQDVATICRRLDGLPLALELAAAHARFLAPGQLLHRLDEALGIPRARDLPERQRTLGATLDWSHDLLTRDEQALFRRVSVFAGGFDLDAVEAIGGDLATLAGLVEQSLVVATDDRFRMLEPVRQYAATKLAATQDDAADRAAGFYVDLAAAARVGLRGEDQVRWLDRLAREHGNLAASLHHLVAQRRLDDAAELVGGAWLYLALRSNVAEGLGWVQQVRDAGGSGPALDVADAGLRYAAGDIAGMNPRAEAAIAEARGRDDDLLADALLLGGGAAAFLGDHDRAAGHACEAIGLGRGTGRPWATAHALMVEGQVLLRTGRPVEADSALREAERTGRALRSPFTLATVLNIRATLALSTGRDAEALAAWQEAARLSADVGSSWTLVYALPGLAVLAARQGQHELAATLFAAGSATGEAGNVALSFPPDLAVVAETLPQVRQHLGEEAFLEAWDAGRGVRPADVPHLAAQVRAPGRS